MSSSSSVVINIRRRVPILFLLDVKQNHLKEQPYIIPCGSFESVQQNLYALCDERLWNSCRRGWGTCTSPVEQQQPPPNARKREKRAINSIRTLRLDLLTRHSTKVLHYIILRYVHSSSHRPMIHQHHHFIQLPSLRCEVKFSRIVALSVVVVVCVCERTRIGGA